MLLLLLLLLLLLAGLLLLLLLLLLYRAALLRSLEHLLLLLTLGMRPFALTLVFFAFLQEAAVVGFVEPAVGEQLQYPGIVTLSVWPFHLLASTTEQRTHILKAESTVKPLRSRT